MKKYIGVKIIDAKPCQSWDQSGEYEIDGYKVRYSNDYESWSPKDVFEEAYRLIDNMTFGLAIEAMKKGFKVARKGWNGKGMFVYLVNGSTVSVTLLRGSAKEAAFFAGKTEMDDQTICDHVDMKAADGSIVVGWLASQTDMLSEDWEIVE